MDVNVFDENGIRYNRVGEGGLNTPQFSKIDINFDGTEEIAIYDRSSGNWMVYEWDIPSGNLRYNYNWSYQMPMYNQSISILRDYNCDGKSDLVIDEGNHLALYINRSNPNNLVFEKEGVLTFGNSKDSIFNRSFDLPGLQDIDGDGDMDILCYGVDGVYLEYYKNTSIENYGVCDSISFELANYCWGHFTENNTSSINFDLNLLDTCWNNVSNPEKNQIHTGSTITPLDYNGDAVFDLLVGDIGYSNLVFAENFGSSPNTNSTLINGNSSFPSGTIPVSVDRFPAAYWIDVDYDNNKDLIVAPNTQLGSNNQLAISFYKNFGTNSQPVLNHVTSGFFQEDMIDFGAQTNVTIADINNDLKMDVLLSSYGNYNSGNYTSSVHALINQSTTDSLIFVEFNDYGELEQFGLIAISSSVGDLNGDGLMDILFGDISGKLHIAFQDISGGFNYQFEISNSSGNVIDVGQFSTPQIIDIDDDNDLDLLVGNRMGTLSFFENTGNQSYFEFDSITNHMGLVSVLQDQVNGGYSKPYLFKDSSSGLWNLIVGSYQGINYVYSDIENNLTGTFDLVDSIDFRTGINTSCIAYDFNNDGENDYLQGNQRGGIMFFEKDNQVLFNSEIVNEGEPIRLTVENKIVRIYTPFEKSTLEVFDVCGKIVFSSLAQDSHIEIDLNKFSQGIYIIANSHNGIRYSNKIVLLNN